MKSGTHTMVLAAGMATILAIAAASPTGFAEPWFALLSDTGLIGDTGGSGATDDTASSPASDTGSVSPPADDTATSPAGDTGLEGGDDTASTPDADGDGDGDGDSDGDADGTGGDTGASGSDTGASGSDTGGGSDSGDVDPDVNEDTGPSGQSAAELAGEKGGCGCTAAPRSGLAWAWIGGLFLAVRRRR